MKELHLALIGGPQYDGLLELLPKFEEQTGYRLHVDVRLPHVELNERMANDLGTEHGCYETTVASIRTDARPASFD